MCGRNTFALPVQAVGRANDEAKRLRLPAVADAGTLGVAAAALTVRAGVVGGSSGRAANLRHRLGALGVGDRGEAGGLDVLTSHDVLLQVFGLFRPHETSMPGAWAERKSGADFF
jgi:hypothetical protein